MKASDSFAIILILMALSYAVNMFVANWFDKTLSQYPCVIKHRINILQLHTKVSYEINCWPHAWSWD